MIDTTHILDLWLNNDEGVYSYIYHCVGSPEELQEYVEELTLPENPFGAGIVRDLLLGADWQVLFKSIKDI